MKVIISLVKFLYGQSHVTVALAAAAGVISALGTVVFLKLINYTLTNSEHIDSLTIISILGISALVTISRAASQILIIRLGQNTIYNLRTRFVRKVLATPLRRLELLGSNQVIASLSTDAVSISGAIIAVPSILINIITIIGVSVYVTMLDQGIYMTLAGCLMVIIIIGYYGPSKRARTYFKRVRRDWDVIYGHFLALTGGIKELKINDGRRERYLHNFDSVAASMRRNNEYANHTKALIQCGGNLVFYVFIITVLFLLPLYVHISTRTLFTYLFVSFYLMGPVRHLMDTLPALANAQVSIEKLEDVERKLDQGIGAVSKESGSAGETEPLETWSSLELKKVVHNYRAEDERVTFTLGPIDLTFRQGEIVFLTGGNGSGKTTLVKLLTGLYSPDEGEIYLGGRQITDSSMECYRRYFSVIFSDCYVFDALLGAESSILDAKANKHLMDLQLADKVKVINGKFSTTALSQGQRKRLALLAMYMEDRPICVFDEWAAEQDPHFRERFYKEILPELQAKGKTMIVISHDDRYYHLGDRVIRLDYGKICRNEPTFDMEPRSTAARISE